MPPKSTDPPPSSHRDAAREPRRPSSGATALIAGGMLLLAACQAAPGSSGNEGPSGADAPPPPASSAELAIVAPVAVGSKLEGWTVAAIHGVDHGTLEIVCEKGSARVALSVALAAAGGPEPPASTERYAVFYSLRGATGEDGERLAKALARVLDANRAAPAPSGLEPFVPRPRSL